MDYAQLTERFGGVVSTRQLLESGETTADIRRAVESGVIHRIRRGWFRMPDADPEIVAIVSDDAVVSCATALRRHGLWIPESPVESHSRVTRYERRRSPRSLPTPRPPDSGACGHRRRRDSAPVRRTMLRRGGLRHPLRLSTSPRQAGSRRPPSRVPTRTARDQERHREVQPARGVGNRDRCTTAAEECRAARRGAASGARCGLDRSARR